MTDITDWLQRGTLRRTFSIDSHNERGGETYVQFDWWGDLVDEQVRCPTCQHPTGTQRVHQYKKFTITRDNLSEAMEAANKWASKEQP